MKNLFAKAAATLGLLTAGGCVDDPIRGSDCLNQDLSTETPYVLVGSGNIGDNQVTDLSGRTWTGMVDFGGGVAFCGNRVGDATDQIDACDIDGFAAYKVANARCQ